MPAWLRNIFFIALASFAVPAVAVRPNPPEVPKNPKVPSLSRRAGYIFSGTVKGVEFEAAPTRGGVATTRVTFHVDEGIRGVATGQTLTIREWAGLWRSGERYRVGERVALFLYPPSKLGLTSPVGGANGRFSLDTAGRIVLKPGRRVILQNRDLPSLIRPRDLANLLGRPEEE